MRSFPLKKAWRLSRAVGLSILLFGLLFCSCKGVDLASGTALSELATSDQPIPKHYESWSLFLVCNPEWMVPEGESNLESLYTRFQAFGKALGPEHVAVWFWSRQPGAQEGLRTAVDFKRSSAVCEHLNLPRSESPYVVVTTEYPGEARISSHPDTSSHLDTFNELENHYVLALNGVPASEATEVLTRLADQIVAEQLSEMESGSEEYWRRWQRIFEGLQSALVDFSNRIRVTLDTQFFTVELSPDEE